MASDWTAVALGDVVSFISGGTPAKARPDYWGGSLPWVSAKDMKRFRLEDAEDHLTPEGAENGTKVAPGGSVLLLTRGMTLLNDVPVCVAQRPMAFNQDVKALRPGPLVAPEYVPYLVLGHKTRLLSMVDLAGHGTGRLNTDELRAVGVMLPPIGEQRAIAHILGTLDDKIDLNRRMNETLEQIARSLFKSWFVDFDPILGKPEGLGRSLPASLSRLFPKQLVDSKAGSVPAGWRAGTVGDLMTLSRETVNPANSPEETFDLYSIPAFDEGKMPKATQGSTIKSQKFVVPPKSVLLSKLNPRFPRAWLPTVDGTRRSISSTEFLVTEPRAGLSRAFLYCLFSSAVFRAEMESLVTGTSGSHQRVRPDALMKVTTVVPPAAVVEAFTQQAEDILRRAAHCLIESRTLAAVRDALLPRLVSGEIRVTHASRIVELAAS